MLMVPGSLLTLGANGDTTPAHRSKLFEKKHFGSLYGGSARIEPTSVRGVWSLHAFGQPDGFIYSSNSP